MDCIQAKISHCVYFNVHSHLGEGKFSQVFEARLALSDAWNSEEVTVAVKKPCSNSNTEQAREEFIREAQTIK